MSYEATTSIILGSSQTGKQLVAQLLDTKGVFVGSPVTSGFVEIGQGNYIWTYEYPDGFRGAIKFYELSVPNVILATTAINTEEIQNIGDILSLLENCCKPSEVSSPNIQTPRFGTIGTKAGISNIRITS